MSKSKPEPAKPEKKVEPPKRKVSLEETAEAMAHLLHNIHSLDLPAQLKRQDLLADYRTINPKWEAVRVHH